MIKKNRIRTSAAVLSAIVVTGILTLPGSATSPRFYQDDPIWVERDTQDASSMKPLEVNLFVDLAYNLLDSKQRASVRAQNVNTVDEVPDSSWFTNRIGHRPMTVADITNGPDASSGPASGTWTVTSSKSDGATPGFTVKDAHGQRWFLKFDPPGYRGMSTGTEVAVTKLMWALGYHVPENHISYMHREQLVVGDGASFTPPGGKKRPMRLADINQLLTRANRESDGSYRIVASKALEGKPIGRIRFRGTRPDDPNDLVAHENRRELRAYGVFAAWLNHVDAKAINSLDTLVTKNGRSFVRHHLIDFGSSLGSGGVGPADYWAGSQYLFEPGQTGRQMASLGFNIPKWHRAPFYESKTIGRLPKDNSQFDPEVWKPRVPNQAFLQARADDKFWAAQRLSALTTDLLAAAVKAGDFRDAEAEAFLVNALAERRDATARIYLTGVNPIIDPQLDANGVLTFRNAAVDADVARAPREYRARWSAFDNATGDTTELGESTGSTTRIDAPAGLPRTSGAFIRVELNSVGSAHQSWVVPVAAYFTRIGDGWRLVGFERMPETHASDGN